jgi:transcriptional regulator GlxA family with amidase domain
MMKKTFYFLILPEFSFMSLACAIEPLRVANSVLGYIAYEIVLVADSGPLVCASNGRELAADKDLDWVEGNILADDHFVVCASYNPELYTSKKMIAALRHISKSGTNVYSIEAGIYLLGKAKLLDNKRACAHWMGRHYFSQLFPKTEFAQKWFVQDGRLTTCSGGFAPFELMLFIIRSNISLEVATRVASQLNYVSPRQEITPAEITFISPDVENSGAMFRITDACLYMDSNIAEPKTIDQVALASGVSRRQMDRQFVEKFGFSASKYYMNLRLEKARYLLRRSAMLSNDVSEACGFSSYTYFYRCYRAHFGLSPSNDRKGDYEWPGSMRLGD